MGTDCASVKSDDAGRNEGREVGFFSKFGAALFEDRVSPTGMPMTAKNGLVGEARTNLPLLHSVVPSSAFPITDVPVPPRCFLPRRDPTVDKDIIIDLCIIRREDRYSTSSGFSFTERKKECTSFLYSSYPPDNTYRVSIVPLWISCAKKDSRARHSSNKSSWLPRIRVLLSAGIELTKSRHSKGAGPRSKKLRATRRYGRYYPDQTPARKAFLSFPHKRNARRQPQTVISWLIPTSA